MIELNQIYNQNCLTGLKNLPDNSIDCCVTSPPYYALRDYGTEEQIGLEESPEKFVESLVNVFAEVKRVLKPTGTLWLNLGDSYWGSGKGSGHDEFTKNLGRNTLDYGGQIKNKSLYKHEIFKPKDLIGIPWMVAFALRANGWYLRQDIIWHKPNPMPESVTDRCTKSHEYIFLMSKNGQYYYDADAIRQIQADSSVQRLAQDVESQIGSDRVPGKSNGKMKAVAKKIPYSQINQTGGKETQALGLSDGTANKRSVWTVTTKPYKEAHFATFPETLIVDCIKAGCPENGIVLDPFMGAGTTALVAKKLNRNYIGFELNPEYIRIAKDRIAEQIGLFA